MSIEWDIEELACIACGKDEFEAERIINDSETDDMLDERYSIDFETYCAIVKDLLPLTPTVTTAIRGKRVNAFVRGNVCIVQQDAGGTEHDR